MLDKEPKIVYIFANDTLSEDVDAMKLGRAIRVERSPVGEMNKLSFLRLR